MQNCTKCIMPENKPGITFNDEGVCNACQFAEYEKTVDWGERWYALVKIADRIKKRRMFTDRLKYDCVIPVSGGKDSTYLALTARDKLGLRPLCVNVAPCEPTERGERNLRNLSKLGFDIFRFYPNQEIMPILVRRSFYEDGDPCTSHEFMLYSVPARVAIQYNVGLIMWAENPQQIYGNPGNVKDASEQRNIGGLWGRPAKHWVWEGVTEQDLISFEHPEPEEIKEANVKAIYLSDYEKWDSRIVAKFAIEHGLEVRPDEEGIGIGPKFKPEYERELLGTGGYWNFEQLDDESPIIGHYLKWQKFGYGRATDHACRDIRCGYITREQGLVLAHKYDGCLNPEYIERFCRYIDITNEEFHRVCRTFYRNPVKF